MEFYQKPSVEPHTADACCVRCGSPMTGDEAALNYKLVDKKTKRILCPVCLGELMEVSPDVLRGMITLFRQQGCTLFSPWTEGDT